MLYFLISLFVFSSVHIRDANNVTHSIHNLRISACDMGAQLPQQGIIKKQLSDAVASSHVQSVEPGANNMMSIGNYDLQLCRKYCMSMVFCLNMHN